MLFWAGVLALCAVALAVTVLAKAALYLAANPGRWIMLAGVGVGFLVLSVLEATCLDHMSASIAAWSIGAVYLGFSVASHPDVVRWSQEGQA
jgi:hypothetical protein